MSCTLRGVVARLLHCTTQPRGLVIFAVDEQQIQKKHKILGKKNKFVKLDKGEFTVQVRNLTFTKNIVEAKKVF